MAKIKQGILGGFSGKIAGIVGTSWKGRAVMKALPLSVANPETEGQVSQRTSFSLISVLASLLLTWVVRPVYNPIAGNITGSNRYTSQNKLQYDGTGVFDAANAFIGGGTLPNEAVSLQTPPIVQEEIIIKWTTTEPPGSPRLLDLAYGYLIEPISGNIWVIKTNTLRSSDLVSYDRIFGEDLAPGNYDLHIFQSFVSADGRKVSIKANGKLVFAVAFP